MTQKEIADQTGVTRITYAKLENGDGSVKLAVLARVLGLMGNVDRFPEVVPPLPVPLDLKALERPARQRARGK